MEDWKLLSEPGHSNWAKISPDGKRILTKEIIYTSGNHNRAGEFPYSIRYFLIDVETCRKSEINNDSLIKNP